MLETAKKEGYAYPAVNVTTIEVINGALRAFSEAKSDGIIQVSIGGGKFASGSSVGNSALGAIVLAEATRRLAEKHNVLVALHTDHCQPEHVDTFLRPLIAESRRRVERGEAPLFNSHMLDASTLPMAENLKLSRELLKECAELGIVLEIEIGVVGGEEDGVDNSGHPADKLYTSPEDMLMTYEALAPLGKFMLAATFGNVHGVYKPGHVKLKPSILRDGQEAVVAKHGEAARMPLVFHGGSGSELSDIREAVSYGVVKMNIDTDTQYAFTRPIVSHMCEHINGVLKIDGEVGNKKDYDPRSYVMIMNDPMREYYKVYEISNYRNTVEGINWVYLNLPNDVIKRAAIASIKAGEAMYASCDVKQYDSASGVCDPGKRFHRVFIPLRRRENEPFPVFFFSVPWASPITGPLTRILPQGNRCGQIKR